MTRRDYFVRLTEGPLNLEGHTLLMPSVGVGNVGQLALDLMISTAKMDLVGALNDPDIVPIVGSGGYAHTGATTLTMPIEVHHSPSHKVVVMQLRAPVVKGRAGAFWGRVCEWIKAQGLGDVYVFSGIEATKRPDEELYRCPIRYVLTEGCSAAAAEKVRGQTEWSELNDIKTGGNGAARHYLAEGGNAYKLFTECQGHGVGAAFVMCYCMEGDNIAEGSLLALAANTLVPVVPDNKFVSPPSWSYLEGKAYDQSLFG